MNRGPALSLATVVFFVKLDLAHFRDGISLVEISKLVASIHVKQYNLASHLRRNENVIIFCDCHVCEGATSFQIFLFDPESYLYVEINISVYLTLHRSGICVT